MQAIYQRIKRSWPSQDLSTKWQMVEQLQQIYHAVSPGERGFMTDVHTVEREIVNDLGGQRAMLDG